MTLNLFTHDGLFHADDVFATAMLSLLDEDYHVERGGDADVPADKENWIIYDIGGGPLDHHTPECKAKNGTHPGTNVPYASCGLVWQAYYEQILDTQDCPSRYYPQVYSRMESSLILGIDASDNGFDTVTDLLNTMPNITEAQKKRIVREAKTSFSVSQLIKDFNPTWNSSMDYYDAFLDAVDFARNVFLNRLDSIISSLDARDYVQNAISYSADHIMIMDQFAPWEGILNSMQYDPKAKDIWYVVTPALRGGWNVQCVLTDSDDRTSYRHPFPPEWYGLRDKELQKVCGIDTAIFCHPSGFLMGAQTEADAIALAQIAADRKIR